MDDCEALFSAMQEAGVEAVAMSMQPRSLDRRALLALAGAGGLVPALARTREAGSTTPPRVVVESVRRIFHNGEHNAFTDLTRFRDRVYLTFRSCPDGHMVHHTASVVVLRLEPDGSWKQVHRFSVKDRDTRDPHFLVFQGKLFVYTGTWYAGKSTIAPKDYEMNLHLGYAVWTGDGEMWNGPVMLEGTFGHYIWRAAAHGGTAYLCGRRKPSFDVKARGEPREVESIMLESQDGLIWRKKAKFQEKEGDETAFLFEGDGSVVGVARRSKNAPAELLRSAPPYTTWERTNLKRSVGGPLIARWNGKYLVGGRKIASGSEPKTSLCWLVGDELVEFAELPSAGDNSYPGFLETGPATAWISYYSSHEKGPDGKSITAIYLAELRIQ